MAKKITISGTTVNRYDGSTVHCVAYKDANGNPIGKAHVPEGHSPKLPDDVDEAVVIGDSTTLSDKFPESAIGNIPDPAETAMGKLDKLSVPDDAPM